MLLFILTEKILVSSKKLIELYELKRMHLLAKESQEIVNEKQKKVDEEQAKLAAEEAKFQPLKDQERELERRQKVDEKSISAAKFLAVVPFTPARGVTKPGRPGGGRPDL